MGTSKEKSTGILLFNKGLQEYGDPIALPKDKKTLAVDIHINSEGYLQKRPGRKISTPAFVDEHNGPHVFDGFHEYIDPDDVEHLLVKYGAYVFECGLDKAVIDSELPEERTHFITYRGRCRYNSFSSMRKVTRTTADRIGIDPPSDPCLITVVAGPLTGDYAYKFTFAIEDASGNLLWESNPSPATQIDYTANSGAIQCPPSDDPRVNARYIYRTTANGNVYQFTGRIGGNLAATIFADVDALDALLGDVMEETHAVPPQSEFCDGANDILFYLSGSTLFWSENAYTESYLEYVPAVNYKELSNGGAGTALKHLYNASTGKDDLLIWQRSALMILANADPNNPVQTISRHQGCTQQDTIVEYDGGLVWLTQDQRVCYYKAGQVYDISSKVIPTSMAALLNPEEASAGLIWGRYYALCCQTDPEKKYNHQVIVFDMDTLETFKGGEDRAFMACDCWKWGLDAQYIMQRRSGAVMILDSNTNTMYELDLFQIFDENPDGSQGEIVAKWQTPLITQGLFSRNQPVILRVKGQQTGTIKMIPYFVDNFRTPGSTGNSLITPSAGTPAIVGQAIVGEATISDMDIQQHIETNFDNSKAGEAFQIYFEKGGIDPYFKVSAYELIYRTISRM